MTHNRRINDSFTPPQPQQVVAHGLSLSRAMHHLHRAAIDGYVLMHRDLKPDNIAFSIHEVRNCSHISV
jgi:serine/threonine protein kinase